MFCKKRVKLGIVFFVLCLNFNTSCFFKSKNTPSFVEKPLFLQQGEYKDGTYLQCTVDKSAFVWGALAGISTRTLVSLAQCGTKFENFKSSVLRPGVLKSMLFWIPMTVGYKYALTVKMNHKLQDRLVMHNENMGKQFSLDGHRPER